MDEVLRTRMTSASLGFSDRAKIVYDPDASDVLKTETYRVTNEIFYRPRKFPDLVVYIEDGFLTDGASVPRVFWSIVPPWGMHGDACVVHDKLCKTYAVYSLAKQRMIDIDRSLVDRILYDALETDKAASWKLRLFIVSTTLYRFVARPKRNSNYYRKINNTVHQVV